MRERMEMDPVTVVADTQLAPPLVHAWSEEDSGQWRTPTMEYCPPGRDWRKLLRSTVRYLAIPGVIAAVALGLTWTDTPQRQEGPKPAQIKTGHVTINPAPAHPDPNEDDQFIGLLVNAGQSIINRSDVIAGGRWVCSYMSQGHSAQDVVRLWDSRPRPDDDPSWSHKINQDYVAAAVKAYCPQLT